MQAIPRTLWLDKSGEQLVQWPIREIEKLRTKEVKLPSTVLKGGSVHEIIGVTAAQVLHTGLALCFIFFYISNL